jgi:formylglycine-generating enzyme required for sulfatase activity
MFSPDDIADLGLCLRGEGFAVSSAQLIACGRLVHGSRRFDAALVGSPGFARYLGPVFCQDQDQQRRFALVYRAWLLQRGLWAGDEVAATQAGGAGGLAGERAGTHARGALAQGPLLVVLALVGALLIAGLLWLAGHQDGAGKNRPAAQGEVNKTQIAGNQAAQQQLAPAPEAPGFKPQARFEKQYRLDPLSCAILASLLAGSLGWWLFHTLRRRGFLQRLPADSDSADMCLQSSNVKPLAVLVNDLRQVGNGLRRRQVVASRVLDLPATLQATVRAGGMARLVFGSKVEPDYLVLVDKTGQGDHQARLFDEMIAALHAQQVQIERYEFDSDPRRVRHAPLTGAPALPGLQSLERLASRHPDARLIVFSDGRGLIDPYTGQAQPWLPLLCAWQRPVLVTPQAQARFGVREWLLGRAGLVLLPLDGDGLQILGGLFDSERAITPVPDVARGQRRALYLKDQDLLLDRISPDPEFIARLLDALKADLGEDGMAWLAGCAVYPELHWGLTLQIGQSLLAQAGKVQGAPAAATPWQIRDRARYAACLAQLVRLRWLRVAYLPDWLRAALLADLPADCTQVLHGSIQGFLANVVEAHARGDALHVVVPSRAGAWRDAWRGLRTWLRPQVREAVAEDKVFLRFMSKPKRGLLLAAGERVTQLLFRHGVPLAGPGVLPLVLAGVLVAGAAWGLVMAGRPPVLVETVSLSVTQQPVPTASTPTLNPTSNPALPQNPVPRPDIVQAKVPVIKDCDICPAMVTIPAGSFVMGDAKSDLSYEKPAHKVVLASFLLGQTEVTQGQWRAVMGYNVSRFQDCGDDCPVERVSWDEAKAYAKKLSELTSKDYRLPSEAEWEYAARAGSSTAYAWGEQASHEHANYGKDECCDGLAAGRDKWVYTAPVASFPANQFDLHDMHGNVWEWVEDCWHANYIGVPTDGRAWLQNCEKDNGYRVLRGGSWNNLPDILRSAYRYGNYPSFRSGNVGFRIARTLP